VAAQVDVSRDGTCEYSKSTCGLEYHLNRKGCEGLVDWPLLDLRLLNLINYDPGSSWKTGVGLLSSLWRLHQYSTPIFHRRKGF